MNKMSVPIFLKGIEEFTSTVDGFTEYMMNIKISGRQSEFVSNIGGYCCELIL